MRPRLTASAVIVTGALALTLPAAATTDRTRATPGTYAGKTGQGRGISLVVSASGRITRFKLALVLPGCELTQSTTGSWPISGSSFAISLSTPDTSMTLSGRFVSSSLASGTLTATLRGACPGSISTGWRAARGGTAAAPAKPKPKAPAKKPKKPAKPAAPSTTRFDGDWEGDIAVPPGLDPDLADELDTMVDFWIDEGAMESVDIPFLVQGAGCADWDLASKDFRPPLKVKATGFTLSFTRGSGGTVSMTGTFDSATRAHGTLTTSGTVAGCAGSTQTTWQAFNRG